MTSSNTEIRKLLMAYNFSPSDIVCEKIDAYRALLLRWNTKIALTTITDPKEVVRFHFCESIFAIAAGQFQNGRLADVGSGAGFPGLAIALAAPSMDVTLIERNSKKAAFLLEVIRSVEIRNARVLHSSIEDVSTDTKFQYVTARAFGHFSDLTSWSADHMDEDGRLALWLGEEDLKLIVSRTSFSWGDPVRIPGADKRILLIGEKE